MGNDQNIDAAKKRIKPGLWLKMRASAISKGQKIHEWIEDAIALKLKIEEQNKDEK